MTKKFSHSESKKDRPAERRNHIRSAKNFLGILGRTTKRLGIRREENLVQRSVSKIAGRFS